MRLKFVDVLIFVGWLCATAALAAPSVVVVGGGLAGLSAAHQLQEQGWQVTVLEAQQAVGGRSALPAMEWVTNATVYPQTARYLKEFGLTTNAQKASPSYWIDGAVIGATALATQNSQIAVDLATYRTRLSALAKQLNDPLQPLDQPIMKALDEVSVKRWLDQLALSPLARALVDQEIKARYEEPARLSLLFLVQQERAFGADPRTLNTLRINGGSAALAKALAKALKTVHTATRVSAITQSAQGVRIEADGRTYTADYAVLAVPLAALAKIKLTPELPVLQKEALSQLRYGWHDQIRLNFKQPFWGTAPLQGSFISNQGLGVFSIEPGTKDSVELLLQLSGDNARLLKSFHDRQLVDQILIRLDRQYPGARAAFTGYELRRSSTNSDLAGAYLNYAPGDISRYWNVWQAPLGRIAFAGEHADALYPGTIEGALRSGAAAADLLLSQTATQ